MSTIFLRAYATIPRFFEELLGIDLPNLPINTYGTFVALGFLAAAYFSAKNLKYRGELGILKGWKAKKTIGKKVQFTDLIPSFVLWFLIGFKFIGAIFNDVGKLTNDQASVSYILSFDGYLVWGIIVGLVAIGMEYFFLKRKELPEPKVVDYEVKPEETIGELVGVAAVFGVLGASVFEIIQPGSEMTLLELVSDPMNFLSGLTIYGGLFFGIIGVFIYAYYRKFKPFHLFDSIAAPYLLAYGIGRLGCHFSGDGDWGKPNLTEAPSWIPDWAWSNSYAHNVINAGEQIEGCTGMYCSELVPGVWPTSIYEFVMCVMLFAVMWAVRKKITLAPGFMFCILFIFNGIERFCIEIVRVTDKYENFFNLTQAQIISVVMIILGVGGIIYLMNRYKQELKESSF